MRYDFIEIGTSDFETLLQNASDDAVGISIEPIEYYLDRLPKKKGVKKINAAMSDQEGYIDIYYIEDHVISDNNLPWWVRGSNSVGQPHPFVIKHIGEPLYMKLVSIKKVPTITWKSLIKQNDIEGIEYLKVDTEGHDHIILGSYLDECESNPSLLASHVKFEFHREVSNIPAMEIIVDRFKKLGYSSKMLESDVLMTRRKIPTIIHQTFYTKDLPDILRENVERIKSINPDFEYRIYDDEDCIRFIRENYDQEMMDIYLSINPEYGQARADLFRYLLMYKEGGVYLDIKSGTDRPLNEIILPTDEYILTHWEGTDWVEEIGYYLGEFQNWHIICVPGHPFLKKTIERVRQNIIDCKPVSGKNAVLRVTGPIAYSQSIVEIIDEHRKYTMDSPVRELRTAQEIGLCYLCISQHHSSVYGGYSNNNLIIR